MTKIEYKLAEMFPRILSTKIAKMGLIPQTWLPGTWLAYALKIKNYFGRNGQSETLLKLIWYVEKVPLGFQ